VGANAVAPSPWVAGKHATPLRGWSQQRLQPACDRLGQASREWANDWGLPVSACEFRARAVTHDDLDVAGWTPLADRAGEVQGWVAALDSAQLLRVLWGHGGAGPIASGLADRCAADALARLAGSLGLLPSASITQQPSPCEVRPWSGAVLLVQAGAGGDFAVLLKAAVMESIGAGPPPAAARPGMAAVSDALRDRRLQLRVLLEGCSLELGVLSGLRLGDVVRLEHLLEQPAVLTDGQGRPCFAGHLARRGDRKTVLLAPCAGSWRDTS
jgi:hypothetical protein